jgi:hypothetical protein
MEWRLRAVLLIGSAQRLTIHGNHIRGRAGQRRHPSDKAVLEFLSVERRKDIAEVIV